MPETRIARLKRKLNSPLPAEICFERARAMTRSYMETEGEPAILRRAKAFFAILDQLPIDVAEDELIVGNVAAKPRVAYFAPDKFAWKSYRPGVPHVWSDHRFSRDLAIRAEIPHEIADYWRDQPMGGSVGHFVADYAKILRLGFNGLREEIAGHRARVNPVNREDREKALFYEACDITCQAAIHFAERHAARARELVQPESDPQRRAELQRIAAICDRVPARPAESFHEALQAFWLTHVMIHINSQEWSISPGRFDQYMYPYYQRDIAAGRLTREKAKELLACLWVKFNEVRIAVDFINYQNLIVGGVDSDGADATNELTWLCLETTEQLRTHQPSLSLRWHEGCPPALLEKACEMIRSGLGLPALFNDRIIVGSLHRAGVSWDDARDYAIAGCEELAVPGKLFGVIRGQKVEQSKCLLRALFNGHDPYSHRSSNAAQVNGHDFQTFDELLQAYRAELSRATHETIARSKAADEANAKFTPHPFVSLLFDGCLERGLDLTRGGARYNITSMTEAGTITAADSLLAIRKAVFEDKILSLGEFRQALLDNFDGHEALRQWLLNQVPKFGNDEDTIDELARQLADMSCDVIEEIGEPDFRGGVFVTGSGGSTAWLAGKQTGATPDGRRAGEALSVSLGPTAGADRNGPTATLNSVAKLNWVRQAGGALTHLKFPAAALAGREGLHNLAALIATFFRRGGMGVHISVVDRATLLAARAEPEKHRDLLVRVGGFSAPFTLLSREIQDNIIARTEQALE